MTDAPMVRFENVTKRYGPLTVLDGLDLDVARGEKVAVIGPSGSGKTTLLHLVAGLEEPDEGEVVVAGTPLRGLDREQRAAVRRDTIGFVAQGVGACGDHGGRGDAVEIGLA